MILLSLLKGPQTHGPIAISSKPKWPVAPIATNRYGNRQISHADKMQIDLLICICIIFVHLLICRWLLNLQITTLSADREFHRQFIQDHNSILHHLCG